MSSGANDRSGGRNVRSGRSRSGRSRPNTLALQVTRPRANTRGQQSARSEATLRSVKRSASKLARAGLLIAGGGSLIGALLLAERAFAKSSLFKVSAVEIAGAVRAEQEELRALIGLQTGGTLVSVDPLELARAVERHPWVAEAKVERRWPNGLRVTIREHQPVALVALEHLYFVDGNGEVVKRQAPGEGEALPVITGLSREDVERGDRGTLGRLHAAVAFLDELHAFYGEHAPQVEELHLDPGQGLTFVTGKAGNGVRAHLARPPWRAALERLEASRAMLAARGLEAAEITIGGEQRPERVVARLLSPEATEQGAPGRGEGQASSGR